MVTARFNPHLHYDMLAGWWRGHGWQPATPDFLATADAGITVHSKKGYHGSGFLWCNQSDTFAVMDMLVTDPKNRPQISVIALKSVIEYLKSQTEARYILTMCKQASLAKLLTMAGGFVKTDDSVTHLVYVR